MILNKQVKTFPYEKIEFFLKNSLNNNESEPAGDNARGLTLIR